MKIKIILTVLLIIGCFWAAIYFSEKKKNDLHNLKEKYKNNYDSIYLSDLSVIYKEQNTSFINTRENWIKIFGIPRDSSEMHLNFSDIDSQPIIVRKDDSLYALSVINLYDNNSFRINLHKEKMIIEAYQVYSIYANKFPKSYIHSRQSHRVHRRSYNVKTTLIYNKDVSSLIKAISLSFANGQIMQLTIIYNRELDSYNK